MFIMSDSLNFVSADNIAGYVFNNILTILKRNIFCLIDTFDWEKFVDNRLTIDKFKNDTLCQKSTFYGFA